MADINRLIDISKQAGKIIMRYYRTDFVARRKSDNSPVTLADTAANEYIVTELARYFPDIPIVSEEGAKDNFGASTFFLVDPLDGTSGFVKGRGEFTVNIGLIENNRAKAGVIYIPVTEEMYFADGEKAFKDGKEIKCRLMPDDGIVVLASKHHRDADTNAFIDDLRGKYPNLQETAAASSLKFCRIAEGVADIYPRFGPTMEWDTAAGQAILQCAGGSVLNPDGSEFTYAKREDWLNGHFIARGI